MSAESALYVGTVTHQRMRPRRHRLRYGMFSLLLDLDRIDALAAGLRVFSRRRFNLFSFYDRDYGDGSATPLRAQVERHLWAARILPDGGPIRLLTMPRILGFAFNPLSVFFCHGRDGRLRAILYEVNNTFGQRHSYLLPVEGGAGGAGQGEPIRQSCAKAFHVSPFMGMDMRYSFTVAPPGEDLSIAITVSDGLGPVLFAAQEARRRPLTDGALLRVFATHPLLTLKVVGGILWEAARLWVKGVPVHSCPAPPDRPISIPPQTGEGACI
ncbi:DUF1365 domain-containing protein [Novosphingobium rosa]|uniref:DUF1365 domain-containing protein n=1 Tax=Novosphingobium rosa TaxID=76978 RepID=UPI00082FFB99|nr:DUF1365 family protein [Novosphingobium rosa]